MAINKSIELLILLFFSFGTLYGKSIGIIGNILILFGFVTYCIYLKEINLTSREKTLGLVIASFGLANLASLALTDASYQTLNRVDHPSKFILCVPLFWILSQRYRISFKMIFWGSACGAIIAGIKAFSFYMDSKTLYYPGDLGHHITFGTFSAIFGLLALILSTFMQQHKYILIGLFAFLCGLFSAFTSGSRSAWLTIIIGVGVILLLKRDLSLKKFCLILIFGLTTSAIFYSTLIPKNIQFQIHHRVAAIFNDINDYRNTENTVTSSVGTRFEMWKTAAMIFSKNPFFGSGPKTFQNEAKLIMEEKSTRGFNPHFQHAHNQFFDTLASTGIIGLICLLSLLFTPLSVCWRAYWHPHSVKRDQAFAATGILISICYVTSSLTETVFNRHIGIIFYLIVICLCLSQLSTDSELKSKSSQINTN